MRLARGQVVLRPPVMCSPLLKSSCDVWACFLRNFSQLLAMDASARVTMKDAAKCDKRREWQNSENQENAERILHFQVIPGSMSTSGR